MSAIPLDLFGSSSHIISTPSLDPSGTGTPVEPDGVFWQLRNATSSKMKDQNKTASWSPCPDVRERTGHLDGVISRDPTTK
jgi:hypothetical protein